MRTVFFILLFANIVTYGIGAGWFGFNPAQVTYKTSSIKPIEFKPQEIHLDRVSQP